VAQITLVVEGTLEDLDSSSLRASLAALAGVSMDAVTLHIVQGSVIVTASISASSSSAASALVGSVSSRLTSAQAATTLLGVTVVEPPVVAKVSQLVVVGAPSPPLATSPSQQPNAPPRAPGTAVPSDGGDAPGGKGMPIGVVVGAAGGAVVLLPLMLYCLRQRRRRSVRKEEHDPPIRAQPEAARSPNDVAIELGRRPMGDRASTQADAVLARAAVDAALANANTVSAARAAAANACAEAARNVGSGLSPLERARAEASLKQAASPVPLLNLKPKAAMADWEVEMDSAREAAAIEEAQDDFTTELVDGWDTARLHGESPRNQATQGGTPRANEVTPRDGTPRDGNAVRHRMRKLGGVRKADATPQPANLKQGCGAPGVRVANGTAAVDGPVNRFQSRAGGVAGERLSWSEQPNEDDDERLSWDGSDDGNESRPARGASTMRQQGAGVTILGPASISSLPPAAATPHAGAARTRRRSSADIELPVQQWL